MRVFGFGELSYFSGVCKTAETCGREVGTVMGTIPIITGGQYKPVASNLLLDG